LKAKTPKNKDLPNTPPPDKSSEPILTSNAEQVLYFHNDFKQESPSDVNEDQQSSNSEVDQIQTLLMQNKLLALEIIKLKQEDEQFDASYNEEPLLISRVNFLLNNKANINLLS
jgi:hypothetical protein